MEANSDSRIHGLNQNPSESSQFPNAEDGRALPPSMYTGENTITKKGNNAPRPCAVVGPDVIPPYQKLDRYVSHVWPQGNESNPPYYCPSQVQYNAERIYPPRNISPRDTFTENTKRFIVPSPIEVKLRNETFSAAPNESIILGENSKSGIPSEAKYCEGPMLINTHSVDVIRSQYNRNNDVPQGRFTAQGHMASQYAIHGCPPNKIHSQGSPYSNVYPELQRYPIDYQNPRIQIVKNNKIYQKVSESSPYLVSNEYAGNSYTRVNNRYEPYPVKEKYVHPRYDYYQYVNQYPAEYAAMQKCNDARKRSVIQPDVRYYPMQQKYIEPYSYIHNTDFRTKIPTRRSQNNVPYQISDITGHAVDPYNGQGKVYELNVYEKNSQYPASSRSVPDPNKIKLDYYSHSRSIPYTGVRYSNENFQSPNFNKNNISYPMKPPDVNGTYPSLNNSNYQKPIDAQFNERIAEYEAANHPKYYYNNFGSYKPLARIPSEFSPNVISPSDSTTSYDSANNSHQYQEDGGYGSQCSTTSAQSADFHPGFSGTGSEHVYQETFIRGVSNVPTNHTHSKNSGVKSDKTLKSGNTVSMGLKQYFANWDEELEDIKVTKPAVEVTGIADNRLSAEFQHVNHNKTPLPASEHLCVLEKVSIPENDLHKYDHIQKVFKLPEHIKDYVYPETTKNYSNKVNVPTTNIVNKNLQNSFFKRDKSNFSLTVKPQESYDNVAANELIDVEAKISQSIIHKDVGCNFEIRPCSPRKPVEMKIELAPNMGPLNNQNHFSRTLGSKPIPTHHFPDVSHSNATYNIVNNFGGIKSQGDLRSISHKNVNIDERNLSFKKPCFLSGVGYRSDTYDSAGNNHIDTNKFVNPRQGEVASEILSNVSVGHEISIGKVTVKSQFNLCNTGVKDFDKNLAQVNEFVKSSYDSENRMRGVNSYDCIRVNTSVNKITDLTSENTNRSKFQVHNEKCVDKSNRNHEIFENNKKVHKYNTNNQINKTKHVEIDQNIDDTLLGSLTKNDEVCNLSTAAENSTVITLNNNNIGSEQLRNCRNESKDVYFSPLVNKEEGKKIFCQESASLPSLVIKQLQTEVAQDTESFLNNTRGTHETVLKYVSATKIKQNLKAQSPTDILQLNHSPKPMDVNTIDIESEINYSIIDSNKLGKSSTLIQNKNVSVEISSNSEGKKSNDNIDLKSVLKETIKQQGLNIFEFSPSESQKVPVVKSCEIENNLISHCPLKEELINHNQMDITTKDILPNLEENVSCVVTERLSENLKIIPTINRHTKDKTQSEINTDKNYNDKDAKKESNNDLITNICVKEIVLALPDITNGQNFDDVGNKKLLEYIDHLGEQKQKTLENKESALYDRNNEDEENYSKLTVSETSDVHIKEGELCPESSIIRLYSSDLSNSQIIDSTKCDITLRCKNDESSEKYFDIVNNTVICCGSDREPVNPINDCKENINIEYTADVMNILKTNDTPVSDEGQSDNSVQLNVSNVEEMVLDPVAEGDVENILDTKKSESSFLIQLKEIDICNENIKNTVIKDETININEVNCADIIEKHGISSISSPNYIDVKEIKTKNYHNDNENIEKNVHFTKGIDETNSEGLTGNNVKNCFLEINSTLYNVNDKKCDDNLRKNCVPRNTIHQNILTDEKIYNEFSENTESTLSLPIINNIDKINDNIQVETDHISLENAIELNKLVEPPIKTMNNNDNNSKITNCRIFQNVNSKCGVLKINAGNIKENTANDKYLCSVEKNKNFLADISCVLNYTSDTQEDTQTDIVIDTENKTSLQKLENVNEIIQSKLVTIDQQIEEKKMIITHNEISTENITEKVELDTLISSPQDKKEMSHVVDSGINCDLNNTHKEKTELAKNLQESNIIDGTINEKESVLKDCKILPEERCNEKILSDKNKDHIVSKSENDMTSTSILEDVKKKCLKESETFVSQKESKNTTLIESNKLAINNINSNINLEKSRTLDKCELENTEIDNIPDVTGIIQDIKTMGDIKMELKEVHFKNECVNDTTELNNIITKSEDKLLNTEINEVKEYVIKSHSYSNVYKETEDSEVIKSVIHEKLEGPKKNHVNSVKINDSKVEDERDVSNEELQKTQEMKENSSKEINNTDSETQYHTIQLTIQSYDDFIPDNEEILLYEIQSPISMVLQDELLDDNYIFEVDSIKNSTNEESLQNAEDNGDEEESKLLHTKEDLEQNNIEENELELDGCWIEDIACVETVISEEVILQDETLQDRLSPEIDLDCTDELKTVPFLLEDNQNNFEEISKDTNSNFITINSKLDIKNNLGGFDSFDNIPDSDRLVNVLVCKSPETENLVENKDTIISLENNEGMIQITYQESVNEILEVQMEVNSIEKGKKRLSSEIEKSEDEMKDELYKKHKCNDSLHQPSTVRMINEPTNKNISKDMLYKNVNHFPEGILVTKGAKKYIPPIDITSHNLKCQLPLPKEKLLSLSKLNLKKKEIRTSSEIKSNFCKLNTNSSSEKKTKPNFEDVLKKIDETNITWCKMKLKKSSKCKNSIPKMIIKKSDQGSHYTSTQVKVKTQRTPDLTGSKWQPWVYLHRNSQIEDMVKNNEAKIHICGNLSPSGSVNIVINRKKNNISYQENIQELKIKNNNNYDSTRKSSKHPTSQKINQYVL